MRINKKGLCPTSLAVMLCCSGASGAFASDLSRSAMVQARTATSDSVAFWSSIPVETAMQEWSLSADEWSRYLTLMQGRARYYAERMPPPMVLAMYARDEEERNRYAEAMVQFEYDKAGRLLAVQRAYETAMQRMHPNEKIIDFDLLRARGIRLPGEADPVSAALGDTSDGLQADHTPKLGDQIVLFAAAGCEDACGKKIRTLVERYPYAPLEVYFIGVDGHLLKRWLDAAKLDMNQLKNAGVTLSRDEGQATQYNAEPGTTFVVRGGGLYEIDVK